MSTSAAPGGSLAASAPALLPSGAWAIEREASTVGFRVRHLGFATVEGRFEAFDAVIDDAGAAGTVDVASVDTGQPIRDARLRSAEFFDAERFPQMTFRTGTPLAPTLDGDLTIRDVTRPIRFDLALTRAGERAVRLLATARISRRSFGLEWAALVDAGRLIVSDRVDITLDLVLVPR